MHVLVWCLAAWSPPRRLQCSARRWGVLLGLPLVLLTSSAMAAPVTLAWDASVSMVDGYWLYYGLASGTYTARVDVGTATTYTLTGLTSGQTYYFVVTAYDRTDGRESGPSNEASTTLPPSGGPTLSVTPTSVAAGGMVTATWAGIPSPSTTDWIGLYTPGASDTAYLAWRYITGTVSGDVPFTIPGPVTSGTYELRLFSNNGFTRLATSNSFTVTGGVTPTVTATTPASGATSVNVGTTVTATFSKAMDTATIGTSTFELRGASNTLVPATVAYNASTNTATLTPSSALANGATYTATVKGGATDPRVKDLAGNALAANVTWSFTTTTAAGPTCPCSLWSNTTTPTVTSDPDTAATEVGVKFQAAVNGTITGIRFYKGAGNTGTHTGKLWTSTGTLLASVTFSNETATGWQQVNFSTPIAIMANTTYVVSYRAPRGHYAADEQYFSAAYTNAPLRALANGEQGGNGVYKYGASGFPTQTFNASNYWVDVVFRTSP